MQVILSFSIQTMARILVVMVFGAVPALAAAEKPPTPERIPGSEKVEAQEVITLIEEYPELVIIDARMNDRRQGYLEDSIGLPDVETHCDSLTAVIPAKSSPAMFYCNGPKCGRSAKSVKIALACGYEKVYWYRGGMQDWIEQGYPYIVN